MNNEKLEKLNAKIAKHQFIKAYIEARLTGLIQAKLSPTFSYKYSVDEKLNNACKEAFMEGRKILEKEEQDGRVD